ncbi:MAG: serine/threonine protein kinase [Actinomycetota bacterium]|nr:serine/threonine protein kinase [Actinomycetota bacterium]
MPQPERESLRRWDPEMIGPYVILGRLGAGSMGQVYLGRSSAGRLVAVKTIRVELAEEASFRTRFAQEVAAARKVSGVFTAAVVEADPDADLPWLATAYVPAPSLSRMILNCGPLPVRTVRWLAAGCAEALESIHGAGLVHRDLKPSNVLVAPDGPRVIDFGVARAAERMELTMSRGAVGTPAYMAPEQARDPHQASVASDVYSLGATLLFAATGHPPYLGASVMDVLARLATEEPDLSGLPAELSGLVVACLDPVPRERPTSSAVLARLGPFTEAQAGPGPAHAYLPEPAMALIGEYQRAPQLATSPQAGDQRGDGRGEETTTPSFTALPAAYQPRRRQNPESGPGRRRAAARERPAWRRWLDARLAWVGWIAVGAALIVGGVILGASLTSSGSSPVSANPPPLTSTSCGDSSPAQSSPAQSSPAQSSPAQSSPGPTVCMVQASGNPDTTFFVHGSGFAPRTPVTVTMSGIGPPPAAQKLMDRTSVTKLMTGPDGTLSFSVGQLFRGPYPLGLFTVDVSAPGGTSASTQFMVIPESGPPPPN